jgi:hypothetical protein
MSRIAGLKHSNNPPLNQSLVQENQKKRATGLTLKNVPVIHAIAAHESGRLFQIRRGFTAAKMGLMQRTFKLYGPGQFGFHVPKPGILTLGIFCLNRTLKISRHSVLSKA